MFRTTRSTLLGLLVAVLIFNNVSGRNSHRNKRQGPNKPVCCPVSSALTNCPIQPAGSATSTSVCPSAGCTGSDVCCPAQCGGTTCQAPVIAPLSKPGSCPKVAYCMVIPAGGWTNYCTCDGQCPGAQKCCKPGCGGLTCTNPGSSG